MDIVRDNVNDDKHRKLGQDHPYLSMQKNRQPKRKNQHKIKAKTTKDIQVYTPPTANDHL